MTVFSAIYKLVRQIPKGKVTSYGQIAKIYNSQYPKNISPQLVGFALHANSDRQTPCHRVVDKTGKIAKNFAFNGAKIQKKLLEQEGITFLDKKHVNLDRHIWNINT